jgi:hypothetical protein
MEFGPLWLSPGRLVGALGWLTLGQVIDIPPIDLSDGTWWLKILIWFLTVYGGARQLVKRVDRSA